MLLSRPPVVRPVSDAEGHPVRDRTAIVLVVFRGSWITCLEQE